MQRTAIFLLVVAVGAMVLFYHLGVPALKNWDEAIYAQVAKEILQSGDWLTMHWQHADWFEKPPLTVWIIAGLFRLFGISEFSVRAVSALAGVGVVAIVYAIGQLQRGPVGGLIATLILLTTFQFIQLSRQLNTDVLLVFFIYLAIYGYLRVRSGDRRWWYLVSVSCALGFMVKSFAVLFAPAAIVCALVLDRQLNETVKARQFWLSVLAGLAIVVPWHAAMIYLHGPAFVNEYFYYHVWSRTTTALEGHNALWWFYLNEMWQKPHPSWALAPLALVFNAWQVKRGTLSAVLLALIVLVFAFYSAAQTKMASYILPLYPALALLISDLLTWLFERQRVAIRVAVILVCVWFTYVAVGKIESYYVKIEGSDEGIKELARLARAPGSPPVLIAYARTGEFDLQSLLFYSDKSVLQATGGNAFSRTRYHNYQPLGDLITQEPAGIILWKDQLEPLLADYRIELLGESHDLVYAKIARKQ